MKLRNKWGMILTTSGLVVIGLDANLARGPLTLGVSGIWLVCAVTWLGLITRGWGK